MIRKHVGGPAAIAGPLNVILLGWVVALSLFAAPASALDWIPPRLVTATLPSATFARSSTHAVELTVRANGSAANLHWAATSGGQFPLGITPTSGNLFIPANGVGTATLSVTVPDTALGFASLSVVLTYQASGARVAKTDAAIYAAVGGVPEVRPVPATWQAQAGTAGSVSYEIHSLSGQSETVQLTTGRLNPDPNNDGALFTGSPAPASVLLPAGGTVTVSAPTTLPANAYAGNLNSVQLSVTSTSGNSSATGFALVTSPLPGSLPVALYPVGLTPPDGVAAGRDGAVYLASRDAWLLPCGVSDLRVVSAVSTDSIGMIDANGDGTEDRVRGTIRIPAFAAALDVIPNFVAASGDTLDLGLLAAGRSGLMLLDLRSVDDPPFGSWSDFYDVDGNGIDDRILRTIPTSGFATDVAWFRAPSGRVVALVADADTGSVPVSAAYNPALAVAGTGMGVMAVDVSAAIDSLGSVPYAAGTLATPGSALDLELRGETAPTLAVADGAAGVEVYTLTTAGGAPATVTFTPRGSVALSSAWGSAYARDLAWIPNTKDSVYVAVAAGAGGLQVVRVPAAGSPSLVMAQQAAAPAIAVGSAWTGTLAAGLGTGGTALFAAPGAGFLDRILPAAAPPFTAPVSLAQGASWAATDVPLQVAAHQAAGSSATSLRFRNGAGPNPDLLVSDGGRLLVLRPGQAAITAVEEEANATPSAAGLLTLSVRPNPIQRGATFEIRAVAGAFGGAHVGGGVASSPAPALGSLRLEIFDLRGRLVRRVAVPVGAARASTARVPWDGLDGAGRRVASGRYWARVSGVGAGAPRGTSAPILILR